MIVAILDAGNLYFCLNKRFPGRKLDYAKYMKFVAADKGIVLVPETANSKGFVKHLQGLGLVVCTKPPTMRRVGDDKVPLIDWGIEITLEVMCHQSVVLGSSAANLVTLLTHDPDRFKGVVASGIPRAFAQYVPCTEITEELLCKSTSGNCPTAGPVCPVPLQ